MNTSILVILAMNLTEQSVTKGYTIKFSSIQIFVVRVDTSLSKIVIYLVEFIVLSMATMPEVFSLSILGASIVMAQPMQTISTFYLLYSLDILQSLV